MKLAHKSRWKKVFILPSSSSVSLLYCHCLIHVFIVINILLLFVEHKKLNGSDGTLHLHRKNRRENIWNATRGWLISRRRQMRSKAMKKKEKNRKNFHDRKKGLHFSHCCNTTTSTSVGKRRRKEKREKSFLFIDYRHTIVRRRSVCETLARIFNGDEETWLWLLCVLSLSFNDGNVVEAATNRSQFIRTQKWQWFIRSMAVNYRVIARNDLINWFSFVLFSTTSTLNKRRKLFLPICALELLRNDHQLKIVETFCFSIFHASQWERPLPRCTLRRSRFNGAQWNRAFVAE